MILTSFRNMLLADEDITGTVDNRIYQLTFTGTKPTLPIIILTKVSEITNSVNMARTTRIQADCYAESYAAAERLADLMNKALTNNSFADLSNGVAILTCTPQNSMDFFDMSTRSYRVSQDYSVLWRPPVL